jgi:hemerythrin-like domain-containing protein
MARRHDALIPLSHDHRNALALAFRLQHPAPPGPVTPTTPASTPDSCAAETVGFFREHLVGHFAIEEQLLFPALRAVYPPGTAEHTLIAELVAEHRQLEELRGAIEKAHGSDRLPAALTAFADLLERHIRREERGLFAHFPGALSRDVVTALQAEIHTRRSPDTPSTCKV